MNQYVKRVGNKRCIWFHFQLTRYLTGEVRSWKFWFIVSQYHLSWLSIKGNFLKTSGKFEKLPGNIPEYFPHTPTPTPLLLPALELQICFSRQHKWDQIHRLVHSHTLHVLNVNAIINYWCWTWEGVWWFNDMLSNTYLSFRLLILISLKVIIYWNVLKV